MSLHLSNQEWEGAYRQRQHLPQHIHFDPPSPQSRDLPGTPPAPMKGKFVVHDALNGWEHWDTTQEDSRFFPDDVAQNHDQQDTPQRQDTPQQQDTTQEDSRFFPTIDKVVQNHDQQDTPQRQDTPQQQDTPQRQDTPQYQEMNDNQDSTPKTHFTQQGYHEWEDINLPSHSWKEDVKVFDEKRWDPFSEEFYTKEEFVEYYGDDTFWNMNSPGKWAQRFMIETILDRSNYILCDTNVNHLLDKLISTFM